MASIIEVDEYEEDNVTVTRCVINFKAAKMLTSALRALCKEYEKNGVASIKISDKAEDFIYTTRGEAHDMEIVLLPEDKIIPSLKVLE